MQPLGIAGAAAHLFDAEHLVHAQDLFLEQLDERRIATSELVAFSVPLYESVQDAVETATALRSGGWSGSVVFYGAYAMLNRDHLLQTCADAVVEGDWEHTLVEIANALSEGSPISLQPGVSTLGGTALPVYLREGRLVPMRSVLPPLSRYEYSEARRRINPDVVTGNVETARGCRFSCAYCSVFAAYRQKVIVYPFDMVLADIDQVVAGGANHICFADADFLNAPRHALRIAERLHERFPDMTFDFTTRADLIAEDPERVKTLVRCGARFVTSALEFPSERVLSSIQKGFGVKTISDAVEVCRSAGLRLNPTFLMFNPWTTFDDIAKFPEFLESLGLQDEVEPIQFQTRLWLYKGSPLLQNIDVQSRLVLENQFNYEWKSADPDVEDVFDGLRAENPAVTGQRCCLKC